jgi:glutamyl/glutaminyl-tRNA synthetase
MRTRFAPSPTGSLHLGHVLSALCVSAGARHWGLEVLLRIDNHDAQRSQAKHLQTILAELTWLGFEPDLWFEAQDRLPWLNAQQSQRHERYLQVAAFLAEHKLLYPCDCSRQRLITLKRNAFGDILYDGRCKSQDYAPWDPNHPDWKTKTWRVDLSAFHKPSPTWISQQGMHSCIGLVSDLAIRDRLGNWNYPFCTVIDDWDHAITHIIRGEDLWSSTFTQLALRDLLLHKGFFTKQRHELKFYHHPLIYREDGQKLSKRLGDTDVQLAIQQQRPVREILSKVLSLGPVDFPMEHWTEASAWISNHAEIYLKAYKGNHEIYHETFDSN